MAAPDGSCPVVLLVSLLRRCGFNKKAGPFRLFEREGFVGDAMLARLDGLPVWPQC